MRISFGLEKLQAKVCNISICMNWLKKLLTCEDRRLEELDELVDLDERIDRHFQLGASIVSRFL